MASNSIVWIVNEFLKLYEVEKVYNDCNQFENFMISSGCDIPAQAKWENIDAYFIYQDNNGVIQICTTPDFPID